MGCQLAKRRARRGEGKGDSKGDGSVSVSMAEMAGDAKSLETDLIGDARKEHKLVDMSPWMLFNDSHVSRIPVKQIASQVHAAALCPASRCPLADSSRVYWLAFLVRQWQERRVCL